MSPDVVPLLRDPATGEALQLVAEGRDVALPNGMQEVETEIVGGGDLYCLSFRTPRG